MACYQVKNLSFKYPGREERSLKDISIQVHSGEFVTVCGRSGHGKTTLLRLLKSAVAPCGEVSGEIFFEGEVLKNVSARRQSAEIGYVMQNPESQIVADKVWHEMAFSLESLGYSNGEIRTRVAEMATFFGISNWFHKNTADLSGGQKQLLNLASVMVLQPRVLILDEPCAQLDPIAAEEFLSTVKKINTEMGTTVIISEHRLENVFPLSDRVIVLEDGAVLVDDIPGKVGAVLREIHSEMYRALPAPMRVFGMLEKGDTYPVTVKDGRGWFGEYAKVNTPDERLIPVREKKRSDEILAEVKDLWVRYEKNSPDVLKGMSFSVSKGEFYAIVGGNGVGKTTVLSAICGLVKPYRGKIITEDNCKIGMLPQSPKALLQNKSVYLELCEVIEDSVSEEERDRVIAEISALCYIDKLLKYHPYDLSGGEQQRVALAKVLLTKPGILLLDEPTKGMDASLKRVFAEIIEAMTQEGTSVIMVSHDIEFCAEFADRCALMFDGEITSEGASAKFFAGKSFYTTSANIMARDYLPGAVLAEDIVLACGGKPEKPEKPKRKLPDFDTKNCHGAKKEKKITPGRIVAGGIFLIMALSILFAKLAKIQLPQMINNETQKILTVLFILMSLACFIPQREIGAGVIRETKKEGRLKNAALWALVFGAVLITVYMGATFFKNKKYYIISLLIMLEISIPFIMSFEKRKPRAREIVLVSVLCAVAIAGRTAFYMIPQFKPVLAILIITGACFGKETGFLVGVVTGFVSNFFFGQGPWTPWQMFSFGIVGFFGGLIFGSGFLKKTKASLCIFGAVSAFVIYGGIMNGASVLMVYDNPTAKMFMTAYISGAPLDMIHAVSTVFFMWLLSEGVTEKLERVKIKYGMMNG